MHRGRRLRQTPSVFSGSTSLVRPTVLLKRSLIFVHRWLAFAVLGMAVAVYLTARRNKVPRDAQGAALLFAGLITAQVVLGISVVLLHVQLELALLHQALAIGLLAANLLVLHRFRAAD